MGSLNIKRDDGTIILPNGYSVSPLLSQEAFRKSETFGRVESQRAGVVPWTRYSFSGGNVSDKNFVVTLCFHDQELFSVTMCVDFYSPGQKDWSYYSLDIESSAKQCHDAMLEEMLGTPDESERLAGIHLENTHEVLSLPLKWFFSWGSVMSAHDFNGGGTYIIINYDNEEKA